MEMFCSIPTILCSSCVNLDTNCGSLLLIILLGSPKCINTCLIYSAAIPLALISLLHGIKTATLVQSWSVTVRMELYPCDSGNLVIKSIATVSNGVASGFGYMGLNGALVGQRFALWH